MSEFVSLLDKNRDLRSQIDALQARVRELEQQVQHYQAENHRLEQERDAALTSRQWMERNVPL